MQASLNTESLEQDAVVWPILINWGKGIEPSTEQLEQLVDWTVRRNELEVWKSDESADESVLAVITKRALLLQALCTQIESQRVRLPIAGPWTDWISLLWTLWLPLAQHIDSKQRSHGGVFIQGILGAQGTGKTTLVQILISILNCLGQRAVALSIDDLYLSYAERCELKREDPRLVWRGPPGTHDVNLGVQTLTSLKSSGQRESKQRDDEQNSSVLLPRFDKSLHCGEGDRTESEAVQSPTVVLFEGWFLSCQPLSIEAMSSPDFQFPAPIVSDEDKQFAVDCNRRLMDYLPLWALIDDLIVLQPQDYRFSLQWRQEAERKMLSADQKQTVNDKQNLKRGGMSDEQISAFVRYFWKALHPELFITPLATSRDTSLVIKLDCAHRLSELYLP